ncbi:tetratricopeptide repeat protein [Rhizorhapis sp. SPR117]|uniref:tetratricopeptide repeat protein n=1 Tax=Rhizorhapis sp. SPR117 TaxID=2912611 RepID=UPI001F3316F7|nr:tetratricopeptide repeat protein [Rhizorhapis sp. SPR117]
MSMKAGLMGASLMVALVGCSSQHAELQIKPIGKEQAMSGNEALAKAELLLSRGEYALAIDAYRKAVRYDPANAAAYNGLAVSYDQLGRHDLSRRYYELALARAPREGKYYRNLARSLESQGRRDEAKMVLAQMTAAEKGLALATPAPSARPLHALADLAKGGIATVTDAAADMIGPRLERLSMGEMLLSTEKDGAARHEKPRMAGHSITVPIPAVPARPAVVELASSSPIGHSITVEIPPAEPISAPEEAGVRHAEAAVDVPLATLDSVQPVRPEGGIMLAAAAMDPEALLAMAVQPVPQAAQDPATEKTTEFASACDVSIHAGLMTEYDTAPSGDATLLVFTGDFAPMRLGSSGLAIDLPLLYPASSNLPRQRNVVFASAAGTGCNVQMADAPPSFDPSFSSLWRDWRDEGGTA